MPVNLTGLLVVREQPTVSLAHVRLSFFVGTTSTMNAVQTIPATS
ncbi:UNVERIFIED_ORG: hypothetical protein CLV66_1058 [Actinomadura viridilutea]